MKIVRFLDSNKQVKYGSLQADDTAMEINGDIFGKFSVGGKPLKIGKLLAPVEPSVFLCIGLNYRRHAEEGKAPIPEFPVLFMKSRRRRAESGRSDRAAAASAQQRGGL